MASELISTGTTDATSADITVAAGTPVTLFLKDAAGPLVDTQARAVIQQKTSASDYFTVGELSGLNRAIVIDGLGTFRVQKFAGPSFGVEQG
jgi:hypothetical protein